MEPTIMLGEKFSADMKPFQPSRGDLVLIHHTGVLLVKRVLGLSGDVVEGRNLQVFVNGKLLIEPHIQHSGYPAKLKTLVTFGPVTVPSGDLFVAGDNRDFSFDSRDPRFGLVPTTEIRGKPIKIVESPNPHRIQKPVQ